MRFDHTMTNFRSSLADDFVSVHSALAEAERSLVCLILELESEDE